MRNIIITSLIAMVLMLASAAHAATAGREYLYVVNTLDRNISVIDAQTFEIESTIFVGDYTDDIEISPDGRTLYANGQVHSGNPFGWGANEMGKVAAFRTTDNRLLWSVGVPGSPHHLAASPDGEYLYVPLLNRYYLLRLDADSGQILDQWHSGPGNHGLETNRSGNRLFIGNIFSDVLMSVDTEDGSIVQMYPTSDGVRPFQLDEERGLVYYQLSRLHGFEVRELESGNILRRIELPAPESDVEYPQFFPHTYNHGLKVTPDGRYLLANASISNRLIIYRLPDFEFVADIEVGTDPNWISVRSDSRIAFVSNRGSDDISVIDLEELSEIRRIAVGDLPQRMDIGFVR